MNGDRALEAFKFEQARKLERFKAQELLELELEFEKERIAHRAALVQATINFEHAAIRVLFLLNGGAAIAALTFAGNVLKENARPELDLTNIRSAIVLWLVGLSMAGLVLCGLLSIQFPQIRCAALHGA